MSMKSSKLESTDFKEAEDKKLIKTRISIIHHDLKNHPKIHWKWKLKKKVSIKCCTLPIKLLILVNQYAITITSDEWLNRLNYPIRYVADMCLIQYAGNALVCISTYFMNTKGKVNTCRSKTVSYSLDKDRLIV